MQSFKVAIVLTACLALSYGNDNKYCSLCDNHTMCIYKNVGPDCKKGGDSGITAKEKTEIVDMHNKLRRQVALGKEQRGLGGGQPKAADLMKFVWDNELAQVAQRWADQCLFQHDTCRNVPRWHVGQNIYWEWKSPASAVNWTNIVVSWYSEVEKFSSRDIEKYRFDFDTGHYTQMLWHSTHAIGCGRRSYGEQTLGVCNYGPAGNIIGTKMYTTGEPCSKCPQETTCEDSLCVSGNTSEDINAPEIVPKSLPISSKLTYTISVPKQEGWKKNPKNPKGPDPASKIEEYDKSIELDEDISNKLNKIFCELDSVMSKLVKNSENGKGIQQKKN